MLSAYGPSPHMLNIVLYICTLQSAGLRPYTFRKHINYIIEICSRGVQTLFKDIDIFNDVGDSELYLTANVNKQWRLKTIFSWGTTFVV